MSQLGADAGLRIASFLFKLTKCFPLTAINRGFDTLKLIAETLVVSLWNIVRSVKH